MSDRLPWFRCFPSALLGALAGLDPDEGLTYVTTLLRIYETGGPVAETSKTLARRTGLAERRVIAAMDRLTNAGKLIRSADGRLDSASTHDEIQWQTERRGDQSSAGKASAAKRQNQAFAKKNSASALSDDQNEKQKNQQNQQNGGNGRSTDDQRPFNHLEKEKERTQVKPTSSPETLARESFPPRAFDEFWLRYPHKVGKHAAETSFDRCRKSGRVPFLVMMTGLDRYIASKPPDRSWCNPATWLNQGRWDDEPSTDDTGSIFGRFGAGRSSGAGQSALAAAVADRANQLGFGLGSRANDFRSRDPHDHRPRRDDPEIEDADYSPAPRYHAAH